MCGLETRHKTRYDSDQPKPDYGTPHAGFKAQVGCKFRLALMLDEHVRCAKQRLALVGNQTNAHDASTAFKVALLVQQSACSLGMASDPLISGLQNLKMQNVKLLNRCVSKACA